VDCGGGGFEGGEGADGGEGEEGDGRELLPLSLDDSPPPPPPELFFFFSPGRLPVSSELTSRPPCFVSTFSALPDFAEGSSSLAVAFPIPNAAAKATSTATAATPICCGFIE